MLTDPQIGGEPVNAANYSVCRERCDADSSCVGFSMYKGGGTQPCSIKSNKPGIIENLGDDQNWWTFVEGDCEDMSSKPLGPRHVTLTDLCSF